MSELVTTKQIAEMLNVSSSCIQRRVKKGTFPAPTIMKVNLFLWDKDIVDEYMEKKSD